jgi:hypothetical protein
MLIVPPLWFRETLLDPLLVIEYIMLTTKTYILKKERNTAREEKMEE